MKTNRLFSGAGLLILAIGVLVSSLVIDVLFQGARIDLTENKLYTLSQGSKNVAAKLEAPVELFFFFSKEATKDALDWRNYAKQVNELLEEFELASEGNLKLHVIDPESFSEEEDQAAEYGLQAVNLTAGGDPVYFGMAAVGGVDDGAKTEIIAFFQPDRQEYLEYDIARVIYQVGQSTKPKVSLISGLEVNGGFDMMSRSAKPAWFVMKQLEELFEIQQLTMDEDEIEADTDLLIVIHPQDMPDSTQFAIDQFVLRGGRLLMFVDPFAEHAVNGMTPDPLQVRSSDLPALFEAWGIDYQPDQFIGDAQLALQVSAGPGQPPFKHLAILQLTDQNHGVDDVTIGQLESLNFSSVGFLGAKEEASTTFKPLLMTSEYAMPIATEKLGRGNDPKELVRGFAPTGERYVLAARVTGPVETAFPNGVPVSEGEPSADEEPSAGEGQSEDSKPSEDTQKTPLEENKAPVEYLKASKGDIQVMIVADTDVLSDRLWVQVQQFFNQQVAQPFADNGAFFVNSVDALSGSSDLISIRSRGRFIRPFTVVKEMQREAEDSFQQKEDALRQELNATEQKLMALQQNRDDSGNLLSLTPEQTKELENFQAQKLRIRKQLREVQHQLNRDIESLDVWLKLINIALVPLLLTLLAIVVVMIRRRRLYAVR